MAMKEVVLVEVEASPTCIYHGKFLIRFFASLSTGTLILHNCLSFRASY